MNGSWKKLWTLLSCVCVVHLNPVQVKDNNPHVPQRLTWQVLTGEGDVIWELSREAPPGTWWPTLYPDLCKLTIGAPSPWDLEGYFDTSRPPTEASPPE